MNRNIDEEQQTATRAEQARAGQAERERGGRAERNGAAPPIDMARLREVGRNLGTQLDEQVRKRPYVVLGAVAGAGFLAGSVLGSRLGQVLVAATVGYAARNVLGGGSALERIQEGIEKLTG